MDALGGGGQRCGARRCEGEQEEEEERSREAHSASDGDAYVFFDPLSSNDQLFYDKVTFVLFDLLIKIVLPRARIIMREAFAKCPNVAIDVAVMEKTELGSVLPVSSLCLKIADCLS